MKRYNVTNHAVERVVERFGIRVTDARKHIEQILQTAVFQGTQVNEKGVSARVFDHYKTRTRLLLDMNSDVVITAYPMDDRSNGPIPPVTSSSKFTDAITATVRREIAKARRTFTATTRTLSEQHALLQIEIGKLTLNKVRCKHPGTQAIIQRKIGAITTQMETLASDIERTESEYKALRAEAAALIGQEVAQ